MRFSPRRAIPRSYLALLGCLVACLVAGCGSQQPNKTDVANQAASPSTDPDKPPPVEPADAKFDQQAIVERSEQWMKSGDFDKAADELQRALLVKPTDTELLFRFARAKAANQQLADAIEVLDSIPIDHPVAGLPAVGQAADWCFALNRFDDAEQRYRKILQRVPDAGMAHRQLAFLLNRQGRRHEASEHVKKLCRLGNVREDELHSLMSLSDAMYDDPEQTELAPGARPYWPIGPVGEARKLFTDGEFQSAAELLAEHVGKQPVPPTVNAFYGRALIEGQDEPQFLNWLGGVDNPTRQCAEYWAAVGTYLVVNQRFDEAVRALGEAIRLDPTDARSLRRIYQALVAVGKDEAAKQCFQHYVVMRDVTLASNKIGATRPPALELFPDIVGGLIEVGRPLEASLWEMIEAMYAKRSKAVITEISGRQQSLASSDDAFPGDTMKRLGIDLQSYPLPKLESLADATPAESTASISPDSAGSPAFENVAPQIGLDHEFWVASTRQGSSFSIYQSVGGGVAVIDFDLDGWVDLYFAQGGSDPPDYIGQRSNVLYRAVDGKLLDVTTKSGTQEQRYSIGITSGDWNQDGFPDLVVANLGANTLLINNGDGTFAASATDALDDRTIMSTSLAIADVTGDAIPDMVEVNYAKDETLPRKPERKSDGTLTVIGPFDFQPGFDRVLVGDGRGGSEIHVLNDPTDGPATGLGLVVADFDGIPGNETFIGNDVRADHLWKRDEAGEFQNIATSTGCAFAASGARTATMGIAAGDFDNTGTLDLHLANYEKEPVTLLLNRGTTFQDRAIQYKLVADSFPVLGFGCQGIDYANDGNLDLMVTNGHVENTGAAEQPYEQPAQLFANLGNQFQLTEVDDPSGYFGSKHVGRALALLDFNRDGKRDMVLTHIEAPSALLINRTKTDHHWLTVQLVGTASERDAVGAKVQIRSAGQQRTRWSTAGDGYLCRNEQSLSFGLGAATQVQEMIVSWPDGSQQTFTGIDADQHVMAVQGEADLFVFAK